MIRDYYTVNINRYVLRGRSIPARPLARAGRLTAIRPACAERPHARPAFSFKFMSQRGARAVTLAFRILEDRRLGG